MRTKARPRQFASSLCIGEPEAKPKQYARSRYISESEDDDVQGEVVASSDSPSAESSSDGFTSESQDDDVLGAMDESASSPAETTSSSDDEDVDSTSLSLSLAVFDEQTPAIILGMNNDHRYCKNWNAFMMSMSRAVDDDSYADMRPVDNSATSGKRRKKDNSATSGKRRKRIARSSVRTVASTKAVVASPSSIDSRSRATASRKKRDRGKANVSRQVSDGAGVCSTIINIDPLSYSHCGNQYDRDRHFLSRTIEGSACSKCGRMYSNEVELASHLQSHENSKPYVCSFCQRGFSRKSYLLSHQHRSHVVDRPFVCVQCGHAFARPNNLKVHESRHAAKSRKLQLAASSSTA